MLFATQRNLICFRKAAFAVEREPHLLHFEIYRDYTDKNGDVYRYYFNKIDIKRSELLARKDYTDHSLFGVYIRESVLENLEEVMTLFDIAELNEWTAHDLKQKVMETFNLTINNFPMMAHTVINISALTLLTKSNLINIRNIVSGVRIMQFFVPFTDMEFTHMPLNIVVYPSMIIDTKEDVTFIPYDDLLKSESVEEWIKHHSLIPDLEFSKDGVTRAAESEIVVPANGYTDFTIKLVDKYTRNLILNHKSEIMFENINGYLPKNRFEIDPLEGRAKIKVGALGLDPGDTIRIKAGFKYYSGVTDLVIPVVE